MGEKTADQGKEPLVGSHRDYRYSGIKTLLQALLVLRILHVQTILDVDLVLWDGIAIVLAADVGNGPPG